MTDLPIASMHSARGRRLAHVVPTESRSVEEFVTTAVRRFFDSLDDDHDLDTSPGSCGEIITTRAHEDRLETLGDLRSTQIERCTGGIVGMGESRRDRAGLLVQLDRLDTRLARP